MAIIDYYVSPFAADDSANGLTWITAKKTIYGCIAQVVTDLDGVTANSATINIAGGIYNETHNLILSKGAHYPDIGGGSLALHDGAAGKEWTIQGSVEPGYDSQVIINPETITTYQTYAADLPSNINYTIVRNIEFLQNTDATKDNIFLSVAENSLVERTILRGGAHCINLNRSSDSIIRYNIVYGGALQDSSSAVKIQNIATDNSECYGNVVINAGGTGVNYHFGLQAFNAPGVKFYGNTVMGAHKIAIGFLSGSIGCEAKNNIFYASDNYEMQIDGTSSATTDYNTFYRSSGKPIYFGGTFAAVGGPTGGVERSLAEQQVAGQDANSLDSDPLVSSTGKISNSSPAIGAGIWIEAIHGQGDADIFDKYIYKLPNIGADQGAGQPFITGQIDAIISPIVV